GETHIHTIEIGRDVAAEQQGNHAARDAVVESRFGEDRFGLRSPSPERRGGQGVRTSRTSTTDTGSSPHGGTESRRPSLPRRAPWGSGPPASASVRRTSRAHPRQARLSKTCSPDASESRRRCYL